MRGTELLDKMELVDPAYVAEADLPMKKKRHWKVWGSLAACLCVAAGAVVLWGGAGNQPVPGPVPPAPVVQPPETGWNHIAWNEEEMVVDACRHIDPGFFTQELRAEELKRLVPVLENGMTCTGRGAFDGEGNLLYVELFVKTSLPDALVTVRIGDSFDGLYDRDSEAERSQYGTMEYELSRMDQGETVLLRGTAEPGGIVVTFSMEVPKAQEEDGKADFLRVLRSFAVYEENKPDLSQITPDRIPDWIDQKLTTQEALADPDFGPWVLAKPPKGFTLEENWRYMSEYKGMDLLSQCWTKGMSQLDWRVEHFTQDRQELLVHPEEREKYDMALYPIPLCDSVPDELREVVDHPIFESEELTEEMVWARAHKVEDAGDTNGWRTNFSVRYGDILVTVNAKGVEPDWLYAQLSQLREK